MILLIFKILLTAVLTITGIVSVRMSYLSTRIMGYGNWPDTLVLSVVAGVILYVTWF